MRAADSWLNIIEKSQRLSEKVEYSISEGVILNLRFILFHLITKTLLPLSILIYQKYFLKRIPAFENMCCLHCILGLGVIFYPVIFYRFTNYFTPFLAIMVTLFFGSIPLYKIIQRIFVRLVLIVFLFIYGYGYFVSVRDYPRAYQVWLPYQSVFGEVRRH